MSQSPPPSDSADDLQFLTAESTHPGSTRSATGKSCLGCHQPIVSTYYALGDGVLCPDCHEQVTAPPAGSGFVRFLKAALMGFGGGLLVAFVWFLIRRFLHFQLGLVAILVGYLVGKGVHKGSGNRGGIAYQILALVLTYCCIAINYMPDIYEALTQQVREHNQAVAGNPNVPAAAKGPVAMPSLPVMLGVVFYVALQAPVFAGMKSPMGLVIIAIALWEAGKFSKRRPLPISGPYQIGSLPAA